MSQSKHPTPTPETLDLLEAAARLRAAGLSVEASADRLRVKRGTLSKYWSQYRDRAEDFLRQAEARRDERIVIEARGLKSPGPGKAMRAKIEHATLQLALGTPRREIGEALDVHPNRIAGWQKAYPEVFAAELDRAMRVVVEIVRRLAGTDAITDDRAAEFIRQAFSAGKWTAEAGKPLFDKPEEVALTEFVETYYKQTRQATLAPASLRLLATTLKYWRSFTGDPPLVDVTNATLAHFRDCLTQLPGIKGNTTLSPNTVRRHLRYVQALLDLAGPPRPRCRDAAGLLERVPYAKPPRVRYSEPKTVTPDQLSALYQAAETMTIPRIPHVTPADWWRTLLVAAFNTGLRRGALLSLRWDWVNWNLRELAIPPEGTKTGRGQTLHLNATTLAHLLRIRGPRELVFPWPYDQSTISHKFQELQEIAGIPKAERFGLHAIRKTLATALWATSPQAAQIQLGHTGLGTTQRFYVQGHQLLADALDRLPQPEAFTHQVA